MASSINADNGVVSGSAGLKSSADSTGVLALQTNGTTAVSISTAQVVSLTSGLAVTGALSATGTGTLRDLITTTGALIQGTSIFRVESTAAALPAGTLAGLGLEMYVSSGTQKLSVYNRTTNLAGPLDLLGSTFNFNAILDISNASAGQIKFPATPNASTDANTLDDYEEGSFTTTANANTTLDNSYKAFKYTKVGNVVNVVGLLQITGSTGSTTLTFTLPFTAAADQTNGQNRSVGGCLPASATTGTVMVPFVQNNTAVMNLYKITLGTATNSSYAAATNADVINGSSINFNITYLTA